MVDLPVPLGAEMMMHFPLFISSSFSFLSILFWGGRMKDGGQKAIRAR